MDSETQKYIKHLLFLRKIEKKKKKETVLSLSL